MKPRGRQLILVSHLPEDQDFGRGLADHFGGKCLVVIEHEEVKRELVRHPDAVVIWNAESPSGYDRICEVIAKHCEPRNVLAMTSKSLRHYPDLVEEPVFGHHLLRRYEGDGLETYFKLVEAIMRPAAVRFERFFSGRAQFRKIPIRSSAHKRIVADVIQKYFTEIGFMGRVAAAASQAIDELILNAVFDAPRSARGEPSRWSRERSEVFDLPAREQVEVVLGMDETYSGVSVSDRFGSLTREAYNDAMMRHYSRVARGTGASFLESGVGLRRIVNSHLSLLHFVEQGVGTRAMMFFSHSGTYKEFRRSCQFVGLLDR